MPRLSGFQRLQRLPRKKKRFHIFESLIYKNGKAQNVPVVAGRLLSLGAEIAVLLLSFALQIGLLVTNAVRFFSKKQVFESFSRKLCGASKWAERALFVPVF